jgi:hypothetical protein
MRLDSKQIMELADDIASDLIGVSGSQGIHPKDLLMAAVIATRLLQKVLAPSPIAALAALQEAEATLTAESTLLEGN